MLLTSGHSKILGGRGEGLSQKGQHLCEYDSNLKPNPGVHQLCSLSCFFGNVCLYERFQSFICQSNKCQLRASKENSQCSVLRLKILWNSNWYKTSIAATPALATSHSWTPSFAASLLDMRRTNELLKTQRHNERKTKDKTKRHLKGLRRLPCEFEWTNIINKER